MDKENPPLRDYFTAKSAGNDWHLTCKICKKRWALPKINDHPGNLLRLLNHAKSHEEK